MGHYKSNVRDLEFNLFEALELEKALASGEFGDLDWTPVHQMLEEAARMAEGPIARAFAECRPESSDVRPRHAHGADAESFQKSSGGAGGSGEWFGSGSTRGRRGAAPAILTRGRSTSTPSARNRPRVHVSLRPGVAGVIYAIGNERATALGVR